MIALATMVAFAMSAIVLASSAMAAQSTPFSFKYGRTWANGTLTWNRNGTVTVDGGLKAVTTYYKLRAEGWSDGSKVWKSTLTSGQVAPGHSARFHATIAAIDRRGEPAKGKRIDTVTIALDRMGEYQWYQLRPYKFCRSGAKKCEDRKP